VAETSGVSCEAMQGSLASYIDRLVVVYQRHCCCTDPRDDAQGGKCGDVVVFSDLDTQEDNGMGGYGGNVAEPIAVRQPPNKAASGEVPLLEHGRLPGPGTRSPRATSDGAEAAAQEAFALRELMKRFVQEMIRGKSYQVVVENGRTEPCKLSLTPNLQYLQLEAAGVTHDIPLRNIKDICPGKLLENRFTPILLDDLCNTLVLRNNECVTFRLASLQERDDFTKCVKVLSLALE